MTTWPLLSLIVFLPLFGALLLLCVRGTPEEVARNSRHVALVITSAVFVLSLKLLFLFDAGTPEFQFIEKHTLIAPLGISYYLGVDAISLALVMLTTFLMPLTILISRHVASRVREYMIAFLILETMMLGAFVALDTILFYVFFEGVLIPMFLIIGIWGGPRRVYAAYKLFLYTLLGSVLMLVALVAMYLHTGTTEIPVLLSQSSFPQQMQLWLWLAMFASFAVKMPMWPVHTWLPDAHVEAPTAGSVILAGVLLKMGGYGFLRFSLPMLPDASVYFAPLMWTLSVIAIIYTSLVALVQTDMKKMIAYSSVAHMGFVTLGLFSFTLYGLQGAMFQMISHGIVSAALFICVGVLYDRMHTREMSAYGGVAAVMPKFAVFFMLMTLAAVGLPGTSGFVGEFLALLGIFTTSSAVDAASPCAGLFSYGQTVALLAATGVVLGAAYMLWLYRKVMFGQILHAEVEKLTDLARTEFFTLAVLGAVVLWLGIHADSLLIFLGPTIQQQLTFITQAPICALPLTP